MTRWFLLTVLFTFVPIMIAILMSFINNTPLKAYDFNNEILFFTMMISAVSLCDTTELNRKNIIPNFVSTIFIFVFVLFIIFSTVIYRSVPPQLVSNEITVQYSQQYNIFIVSLMLATVSFIWGTIIQILLGRNEGVK